MDQLPLDSLPADVLPTNALNDMLASMAPLIIISLILVLIATTLFIAHMVRAWYVQSATIKTQKDIAIIKDHLLQQSQSEPYVQPQPQVEHTPARTQTTTSPAIEQHDTTPRQDS